MSNPVWSQLSFFQLLRKTKSVENLSQKQTYEILPIESAMNFDVH